MPLNYRKTYLFQVYQHNKKAFAVLVILLLFYAFVHIDVLETTPAFLWGMFSKPSEQYTPIEAYEIIADGKSLNYYQYPQKTKDFGTHPFFYYKFCKDELEKGITTFEKKETWGNKIEKNPAQDSLLFEAWAKRYWSTIIKKPIQTLEVNALTFEYDKQNNYQLKLLSSTKLITKD